MNTNEARTAAVERHDMRERINALEAQNARLLLAVKNLHMVLRDVSMNIDVSTINNSKRNTQRWGDLRVRAAEVLDITQGWTK
jgi:hypothetical protein